jgi:gentisate 1,2-dioxygenase
MVAQDSQAGGKMRGKNAGDNLQAALDRLHEDVAKANMAPYWVIDRSVKNDEDRQVLDTRKAIPFAWNYKNDIEPLLYRSAELISTETSERRSLVLVNPGLAPKRAATTNMYVAYRLNDPREIMPPHRHAPSAIRLGLTGKQNFTGVEGENITFGPGDLVLTPHDTWHNHGNRGDDNAINLSVLDLPLAETMNAMYFEHDYTEEEEGKRVARKMQSQRFPPEYSQMIYGRGGFLPRFVSHNRGAGATSPMFVYRYDMMREMMETFRDWDGDPHEALMIEYVDPTTGGPVYRTITFFMQMLRPGERTLPLKQSASLVIAPFEGKGRTIVGDKSIDWNPFDTVAVPGGTWYEHVNTSDKIPAILFVASDEPALKALAFYQKHGKNKNGDIMKLS